jgi:hypothetical protein
MKFNFWRIGEYLVLSKEVYYWDNLKIAISVYLFYIVLIWIFTVIWINFIDITTLIKESSQELINAFTLISGFMLTWISIMLATWKVENIEILKKRFNKNEDWVNKIISKLKKILFYEISFQFIIIILVNISIALIKWLEISNSYFIGLFIVLVFISLIMTYRLIDNFIAFENMIGFKVEN